MELVNYFNQVKEACREVVTLYERAAKSNRVNSDKFLLLEELVQLLEAEFCPLCRTIITKYRIVGICLPDKTLKRKLSYLFDEITDLLQGVSNRLQKQFNQLKANVDYILSLIPVVALVKDVCLYAKNLLDDFSNIEDFCQIAIGKVNPSLLFKECA
ncbi:hypothetical protein [Spartinivicinus poritis]|uniref:Uncharacterized protein n=1 Tax=Spartinivicinus poritis TaxID=2994640 RepID=A0ABT5U7W4_9GAMM|nr:hypothetical protein [Spartinivicinus sp. A2-2]MDE1462472.1 hypothetical protein [Spartinivicinus sp. A2-2]